MRQLTKKPILVAVLLVVVLGIALGVGLGVGLARHKDDDDDDNYASGSSSSNTTKPTSRSALWQPEVGAAWQIVLLKPIKIGNDTVAVTPDVDIYDIDLFDNDADTIAALRSTGKRVICYFSAGSWEDWRDDKAAFAGDSLGKQLHGWSDERWVNVSAPSVREVMKKRIGLAAAKGCDAIDPDNVDGYQNENGLGLTAADAVGFVKFLSTEALQYNMSTGLKNAGDIIPDVLDAVHFSVKEQCVEMGECKTFALFIAASKPVFHIEYPPSAPDVPLSVLDDTCSHRGKAEGAFNFSTVLKTMDLNGWVEYCDGKTSVTESA